MTDSRILIVDEKFSGTRLDKFLTSLMPDYSRSRIQSLLLQKMITRNDVVVEDAAYKTKAGEIYHITIPPPLPSYIPAWAIDIDIVYEDNDLLVVNKAAGITVHPAPGHRDNTLVNALIAHCGNSLSGIGGELRPGIVHRLDKDTSGLMIVAKNDAAHRSLSAQLADRSLSRTYQALCWGKPNPPVSCIKTQIGRSPINRQKMAVVKSGGKSATTYYQTISTYQTSTDKLMASLVECKLETGRTHQIRVHMLHIGNPIIGDPVYGQSTESRLKIKANSQLPLDLKQSLVTFKRQALHAKKIAFIHPTTNKKIELETELPSDMQQLIESICSSEKSK